MSIKELHTRIALKYDSYSAWTTAPGKDLVLLKGEIGICEIPSLTEAATAPTILFKVGDGESTFENLKWASALAADVYAWAKAETVILDGTIIKFKTGDTVKHTIDLSSFATDLEVQTISAGLDARITALENEASGGIITTGQFEVLDQRLDVIEGDATVTGSVANAIKVAKGYADEKEITLKAYADQAESDANSYTDSQVSTLEASIEDLASQANDNEKAIEVEAYDRETADNAINAKIGEGFDATNTVQKAIEAAAALGQQGIDDAATVYTALTTLTNGSVATNTAAIEQLRDDLDEAVEALETKDTEIDDRLKGIEAFFNAADHDGEEGGLRDALDTLVEIQNYLSGEGSATGGLLSRIAAAEGDIDTLEATLATGGAFANRVDRIESSASANADNISTLQKLTSGYTDEGSIKAAVDKAQEDATKGIEDAALAKLTADNAASAAGQAQNEIDILETLVTNIQAVAEGNADSVTDLSTRMESVEGTITNLQAIVSTGDNSNEKLRAAITALQTLTGEGTSSNATLRSELTELQGSVSAHTASINAAKAIADSALAKAVAIEDDYLTSGDEFIFQCGTSTEITHTTTKVEV